MGASNWKRLCATVTTLNLPCLLQYVPITFFNAFFVLVVKDCVKNCLITVPSLPTSLALLQPVFFYSFFFSS